MNKKTKFKLNETLDKALLPPRRDISKLDAILSSYDVAEHFPSPHRSAHEFVPPTESEKSRRPTSLNSNSERLEDLDSQTHQNRIAKESDGGYPNQTEPDSQTKFFGYPDAENPAIQTTKNGYPNTESLDSLIAKEPLRIAKETPDLDSLIAKDESLAIQKPEKKAAVGKWGKYDKQRSNKGTLLRTDEGLTVQFKQFCLERGFSYTEGTEMAWAKLMTDSDSQNSDGLAIKIAVNNKQLIMMSKSKASIINIYYAYNRFFTSKLRWSPKDDRAGEKFNDVDARIIELGIIQTQCNLLADGGGDKVSINGFQYYSHEILRFMQYEGKSEVLDTILKINREMWTKQTGKTIDYTEFEEKEI